MYSIKKILALWIALVACTVTTQHFFSTSEFYIAGDISFFLQLLLLVVALAVFLRDPNKKNRVIFINFAILFAVQSSSMLLDFVHDGKLKFLILQYISFGLAYVLLGLAVVYLAFDVLFRDYRTYQKYLLSLAVVVGFFGYYYNPMLMDKDFAYTTAEVRDWKALDEYCASQSERTGGALPSIEELSGAVTLHSWNNGVAVADLWQDANVARIQELYPYLEGDNYRLLVFRPIFQNVIKMCVVSIGFILLFFGYVYMKDPPQGAYIEKIMFLMLVYCSLEILHMWSTIHSLEWGSAMAIWSIGAYVSDFVLLLLTGVFLMRLRFITSVRGEFYEQELAANPSGVTRWRDGLDNVVIDGFFNRKMILGRLFVNARRTN
jgi:hypothetical protein